MENALKNLVSTIFETGRMEVEDIVKMYERYPNVIEETKEFCKETSARLNFGALVYALVSTIKNEIDYSEIMDRISEELNFQNESEIKAISKEIESFIESISIDDNHACWGEIANSANSRFEDIGDDFKDLVIGEIELIEFYDNVTLKVIEILRNC